MTELLTMEEETFVDQKVNTYGKSKAISYLLWFFFGIFGVHRFYNGLIKSGIAMILLYVIGIALTLISLFSMMNISDMKRYSDCVQANPHRAERVCARYLEDNTSIEKISVIPAITGGLFIFFVGLWWLIDAFLIPGIVNRQNEVLRDKYTAEVLARRQSKVFQENA